MGKLSRTKGHSFERKIAQLLRPIFPNCRRHLEYHSRDANGVDLVETDEFKIQCKKLKRYASINTIKEIQCDQFLGDVPVLVTAEDGGEIMAVLPFHDLVKLIAQTRRIPSKVPRT